MKDKIIPPPQEVNQEIENAQLQAEVKAKKKDKKKLLKELIGAEDVSLAARLACRKMVQEEFLLHPFSYVFDHLLCEQSLHVPTRAN